MNALRAAFVLAQGADLLTGLMLPPGAEANPIVVWLGPAAVFGKMVLIVYVVYVSAWLDRRLAAAVLAFGTVVGLIGLASNLPWLV